MELNSKQFKYIGVGINYNKFSIEHNGIKQQEILRFQEFYKTAIMFLIRQI